MFLDRFLFELSCKNTHIRKHTTHTHTDTHKDSNEYSIVAFCKNATIKTADIKQLKSNRWDYVTNVMIGKSLVKMSEKNLIDYSSVILEFPTIYTFKL